LFNKAKKAPKFLDFDSRLYTSNIPHLSQNSTQNGHLSDLNAELLKQLSPPNRTVAKDTVAIILPYRNRYLELFNFLFRMHVFLRKQTVQYVVLVAEQSGNEPFNRAKLFNAAVREIRGSSLGDPLRAIDCFILHDVDKVPILNSTIYNCGPAVRQMATAFESEVDYQPLYDEFLGAVTAFRWEHLEAINGASNVFYGWGGEDDDIYKRLQLKKMPIDRTAPPHGIFFEFNRYHTRKRIDGVDQLIEFDNVKWRMQLYAEFLGAVTAFRWGHLEAINGESNVFYSYGGEDEDIYRRRQLKQLSIDRASKDEDSFFEFSRNHSRKMLADRAKLIQLDSVKWRMQNDGLAQTSYRLVKKKHYDHFVWMLMDL
uniref:Beta-1,4-galactosyltransferase n=1 Tax=Schistocephalus solidus TaxID=70667 RepID=A0A183SRN1_SCHSO